MRRTGTALVTICAVLMLVFVHTTPAQAAPSRSYAVTNSALHNREVDDKVAVLELKYDIHIDYPTFARGGVEVAAIYPETLETLDAALGALSSTLVRKVSTYFQEEYGLILSVAYVYADMRGPYGQTGRNDVTVGTFDSKNARIELYIPHEGQGAVATGDNVLTITHEFGHALHQMVIEQHGAAQLQREWNELQIGHSYGRGQTDPRVFITEYASTAYEEDFAETFAHVFACNRPGLGFSNLLVEEDGQNMSVLGRKVAYIEYLLEEEVGGISLALTNYRKIYTTPVSTTHNGIKLSGFHLVAVGMDEPRTIPLMLVTLLRVNESNTVWIAEIGGWYTTDLFGNHLCLFPDGTWGNAGRNMLAA